MAQSLLETGKEESRMSRNLLVVNPGSSSFKFALHSGDEEIVSFHYESLGDRAANAICSIKWADGRSSKYDCSLDVAFDEVRAILAAEGLVDGNHALDGIPVRLVATGQFFTKSRIVNQRVMNELSKIVAVNILHVPSEIQAIKSAQKAFGDTPIIVISDSEALAKPSRKDLEYGLPLRTDEIVDVVLKRYGAHGISHGYIIGRMAELNLLEAKQKVITCHLGSGCSITAFESGEPIYHSMGLTPLEGLMSSTRAGAVDPTIGALLGEKLGAVEAIRLLNKESGLKALTGSGDMRDVIELAMKGDRAATKGLNMFVEGVAGTIGKYATVLKGVDAVVFTATIGERSSYVRAAVADYLWGWGYRIGLNNEGDLDFSKGYVNVADSSSKPLCVIPTNESAYMIRRANQILDANGL